MASSSALRLIWLRCFSSSLPPWLLAALQHSISHTRRKIHANEQSSMTSSRSRSRATKSTTRQRQAPKAIRMFSTTQSRRSSAISVSQETDPMNSLEMSRLHRAVEVYIANNSEPVACSRLLLCTASLFQSLLDTGETENSVPHSSSQHMRLCFARTLAVDAASESDFQHSWMAL